MVRWLSLSDQVALAEQIFGDRGPGLVEDWLAEQVARIDDPGFAEGFAAHVELSGVVTGDFNHRDLRTTNGRLLGGIRFYGRDVRRPFVEVCCHDFAELDDLRACVRSEWSAFAPKYLRLQELPGRVTGPGVVLDTTLHAARYRDMPAPDGRITLEPFDRVEDAVAMVERRYALIATSDPALRHNVSPAAAEDLWHWHATGELRAIRAGDATIGLLAVAPGTIGWLPGDEINEEIVDVDHLGHGYAAAAQCTWAKVVANDPGGLLIGTIDRLNGASRITAERAGRPPILEAVFVSLGT
ncbi:MULTISPECIES: hypothetical protein [unclassified Mycobacterium]|uniref:hypothetical protein n=1 Tax=unclassified Mycobacterium TaxID=2642494 RepID=UPI0029C80714|nr:MULTISPECIES: hypothetical protein [unclassified Mycobacterium]